MRKKTIALIVLSMLLALLFTGASALAMSTEASVAFEDGTPEFGDPEIDPGLNDMAIYFGKRALPIGRQVYGADDGAHTLRIADPRSDGIAGNWVINVSLSAFSSGTVANTFDGTVTLVSPSEPEGVTVPDTLIITSGPSSTLVATAAPALEKGNYDITWAKTDISLTLEEDASDSITQAADYKADFTWTMVVG